jgi:hypothetical protein
MLDLLIVRLFEGFDQFRQSEGKFDDDQLEGVTKHRDSVARRIK